MVEVHQEHCNSSEGMDISYGEFCEGRVKVHSSGMDEGLRFSSVTGICKIRVLQFYRSGKIWNGWVIDSICVYFDSGKLTETFVEDTI
jgi:hypothetical protein